MVTGHARKTTETGAAGGGGGGDELGGLPGALELHGAPGSNESFREVELDILGGGGHMRDGTLDFPTPRGHELNRSIQVTTDPNTGASTIVMPELRSVFSLFLLFFGAR